MADPQAFLDDLINNLKVSPLEEAFQGIIDTIGGLEEAQIEVLRLMYAKGYDAAIQHLKNTVSQDTTLPTQSRAYIQSWLLQMIAHGAVFVATNAVDRKSAATMLVLADQMISTTRDAHQKGAVSKEHIEEARGVLRGARDLKRPVDGGDTPS